MNAPAEEGEEPPEEPADDREGPDLSDEQADLDLGIDPDEIEEAAGRKDDDDGDDGEEETPAMPDDGGQTWGDMYVTGLVTMTNAVREEYGSGEQIDEQVARDIDLDYHFDEWMRSRGKREDMPPEQALLVGTCMFILVAGAGDSELVGNIMGEI